MPSSSSLPTLQNKSVPNPVGHVVWQEQGSKAYRFRILLMPEDDGSWSAIVLNLPGIGSCGSTEDEAMTNAKEAILAALEGYGAAGQPIPWKDSSAAEIPRNAKVKWIILNG